MVTRKKSSEPDDSTNKRNNTKTTASVKCKNKDASKTTECSEMRSSTPLNVRCSSSMSSDDISGEERQTHRKLRRKSRRSGKKGDVEKREKNKQRHISSSSTETESDTCHPPARRKSSAPSSVDQKSKLSQLIEDEDSKSSSSREFQKTKILPTGQRTLRKISEETAKSESSTFEKRHKKSRPITRDESYVFTTRMTKMLDKLKNLGTEFEANLERIKFHKFRKELEYFDDADSIVLKVQEFLRTAKRDLDEQSAELDRFYQAWTKNHKNRCEAMQENENREEGNVHTAEVFTNKAKQSLETPESEKIEEAPIQTTATQETNQVVSDCDSDEIFSGNEQRRSMSRTKAQGEESKNENDEAPATALSPQQKSKSIDRTPKKTPVLEENDTTPDASAVEQSGTATDDILNESAGDMFETDKDSTISVMPFKGDSSGVIENITNNSVMDSDTIPASDDEEATRIALLRQRLQLKSPQIVHTESLAAIAAKSGEERLNKEKDGGEEQSDLSNNICDSNAETFIASPAASNSPELHIESRKNKKAATKKDGEESANSGVIEAIKSDADTEEEPSTKIKPKAMKSSEQKESSESGGTSKARKGSDSSSGVATSLDEETMRQLEQTAKLALLNSNSDDSESSREINSNSSKVTKKDSSEKESADESTSSERHDEPKKKRISSDANDNSNSGRAAHLSRKQRRTRCQTTESVEKGTNSRARAASARSRRQRRNNKVYCDKFPDQKLRMDCVVNVRRLPKAILKRHQKALQQSEEHLDDKTVDRLIDLEELEETRIEDRKNKNTTFSSSSKKKNKPKAKTLSEEEDDTLLDHLHKVKTKQSDDDDNNDGNRSSASDADSNHEYDAVKSKDTIQTNAELKAGADKAAKDLLLNSSDSDLDERKDVANASSDSEDGKKDGKENKKKTKTQSKDAQKSKDNNDKAEDDEKRAWRRDNLLTMRLSDSESDDSTKRSKSQNQKRKDLTDETDSKNQVKKTIRKRRRRRVFESDSDAVPENSGSETNSNVEAKKSDSSDMDEKKRTRKRRNKEKTSDSDSSQSEKKSKRVKRRRIKQMSSGSETNSGNENANTSKEHNSSQGTKGRKNIRKVLKDKQVAADTKQAAKEEEERLKRIAERQKLYNEVYEARRASEVKLDKLVLDFDPETKNELVSVDPNIVKHLKPHQAEGIKFMWESCFESLERMKESSGSGCILAHCMGLGKTLQVIAFLHTLFMHDDIPVKTALVVSPLSTVLNWVNEFRHWLDGVDGADDIEIFELTKMKKNTERVFVLKNWVRTGGVLIMSYDMFRNLTGTNKNIKKKMKESILACLVDPGPDIVICDEGHLLKNEETAISKCMKSVKTRRRIVLTGTPLQNNLIEYHCMVQFVKPNLLGTKKEFSNRFVHPITNGQFDDSTAYDVKLMKKRAYVLHKMLKGSLQRFDYSVLTPFLPPKEEYVISVTLSDVQIALYRHYITNYARRHRGVGLFADFQALQRIWTHPLALRYSAERIERMNERASSDSEGSLRDFIKDETDTPSTTTTPSSSDDDEVQITEVKSRHNIRSRKKDTESDNEETQPDTDEKAEGKQEKEWWADIVPEEQFDDIRASSKLVILFAILKECQLIGDKLLVFSQSLDSLRLIENFLAQADSSKYDDPEQEEICGNNSWILGADYFRLDGQTSPENRNMWCKIFNNPNNTRARVFLISTKAGGLGITLTAANRVVIFDASWNPSHDVQSIFRIYRFGQRKPCYIYRLLAAGTMEEKIYSRQVTKLSLSCRVVDEQQIERHYSNRSLNELYSFEPNTSGEKRTLNVPKDRILAEIFLKFRNYVENYHEHDSLLENKTEEELNEEERKQAWLEYEQERKGVAPPPQPMLMMHPNAAMMQASYGAPQNLVMNLDYQSLQELIRKDFPNATPDQQQMMTARAIKEMYAYYERQTLFTVANKDFPNAAQSTQNHTGMLVNHAASRQPVVVPHTYNSTVTSVSAPPDDDDIVEC